MEGYRVENKNDVRMNGRKTSFHIYEIDEDDTVYIHIGSGFARGYNATDDQCINAFLSENKDW